MVIRSSRATPDLEVKALKKMPTHSLGARQLLEGLIGPRSRLGVYSFREMSEGTLHAPVWRGEVFSVWGPFSIV